LIQELYNTNVHAHTTSYFTQFYQHLSDPHLRIEQITYFPQIQYGGHAI
jgi:hypothetical protein